MYQRKYKEPNAQWEDISEEACAYVLGGYYNNVPELLQAMKEDQTMQVRTNFAWYRFNEPLENLEGYTLLTDSQELDILCENLGLTNREDITGALVKMDDGDYLDVLVTESKAPYSILAYYYRISVQ